MAESAEWSSAPSSLDVRAHVQRVCSASVTVDGDVIAQIGLGLLVLLGVTHTDTSQAAARLAAKVHGLRILRDEQSLATDTSAAALVVSQFTLYADTRRGRRPSWSLAAPGPVARPLVESFVAELGGLGTAVATGRFGADMQVALVNDGPVTLLLEA